MSDDTHPAPSAQRAPIASPRPYPVQTFVSPAAKPPPNGALAWGLGLLALLFPIVGSIAAGAAMIIAGLSMRKYGGVGGTNGRNAANWGATYLLLTVLLVGTHFGVLIAVTADGPVSGFFPIGIPITVWAVVSLCHVIFSGVGLVRAARWQIYWVPAIPFFGSNSPLPQVSQAPGADPRHTGER